MISLFLLIDLISYMGVIFDFIVCDCLDPILRFHWEHYRLRTFMAVLWRFYGGFMDFAVRRGLDFEIVKCMSMCCELCDGPLGRLGI